MVKFRKPMKSDQHNSTQSVPHPPMAPRPIECLESRRLLSTYYVDAKTGDDSWTGTSLATPWRTLQSALDRTASGDVITLRAYADAEYTDNLDNFDVYTPNLTIRTYAGDLPARAIISAVNNLNNEESTLVVTSEAANTKLYDLEIKGGNFYALKLEASGAEITNCDLHHSGRDVVKLVRGADNATLTDCEIHHSGMRDASNAEGIDNVAAHYFTLQDSVIHDTATDGVYVKGGARWCVIQRNRVYDIGGSGISLGQTSGWDNFADVSQNPGWYENIDGVVRNNIVLSTGRAGISLIGALRPKVYNNTLIDVAQLGKAGIYIAETYQYPNDLGTLVVLTREAEIKNNIVQVSSSQPVVWITQYNVNATLTFDYNCYYHPDGPAKFQDEGASFYDGSLENWRRTGRGDVNSLQADPQLDSSNYTPLAGSPVVDRGQLLSGFTDDYGGNTRATPWDIGAQQSTLAATPYVHIPWGSVPTSVLDTYFASPHRLWIITGTDSNDTILVRTEGTYIHVYANNQDIGQYAQYEVYTIVIHGNGGDDAITNETSKSVVINGGSGNDSLLGGSNYDYLDGGSGRDTIEGGANPDLILGGSCTDLSLSGPGDSLLGGDGDDTIQGDLADDTLWGHRGDDALSGFWGNDYCNAGEGNDRIAGGAQMDTIYGGSGHDSITGEEDDDLIYGDGGDPSDPYGGNDTIDGAGGDDTIEGDPYGGIYNDSLRGGMGNDFISGGYGNDLIYGDEDSDVLVAGEGNDSIYGGSGADTMYGGSGDDSFTNPADGSIDTIDGGAGSFFDSVIGGDPNDVFYGVEGIYL